MLEGSIKIKKLKERASVPVYGSEHSAGADLIALLDSDVIIKPGQTVFIPTGLSMEIPEGYAGLICARSGLSCKEGLAPANKVGVIDSDYRGEIIVALFNHSDAERAVTDGERIAQMLILPYLKAVFSENDSLCETLRGGGGFGSTGKK